jgi:hypothetical protein
MVDFAVDLYKSPPGTWSDILGDGHFANIQPNHFTSLMLLSVIISQKTSETLGYQRR